MKTKMLAVKKLSYTEDTRSTGKGGHSLARGDAENWTALIEINARKKKKFPASSPRIPKRHNREFSPSKIRGILLLQVTSETSASDIFPTFSRNIYYKGLPYILRGGIRIKSSQMP